MSDLRPREDAAAPKTQPGQILFIAVLLIAAVACAGLLVRTVHEYNSAHGPNCECAVNSISA